MSLGSIFGALFFSILFLFVFMLYCFYFFCFFFLRVRLLRVISIKKKTVWVGYMRLWLSQTKILMTLLACSGWWLRSNLLGHNPILCRHTRGSDRVRSTGWCKFRKILDRFCPMAPTGGGTTWGSVRGGGWPPTGMTRLEDLHRGSCPTTVGDFLPSRPSTRVGVNVGRIASREAETVRMWLWQAGGRPVPTFSSSVQRCRRLGWIMPLDRSRTTPRSIEHGRRDEVKRYGRLLWYTKWDVAVRTCRPVASLLITGGVVLLRFWIFFRVRKLGVPSGCLGETSIFKIIMIDDVTLWSKLESRILFIDGRYSRC